jgi:hypothetical protein
MGLTGSGDLEDLWTQNSALDPKSILDFILLEDYTAKPE